MTSPINIGAVEQVPSDIEVELEEPGYVEELTKIKVDKGVEYVPKSLIAQEWIERTFQSPATMVDEPWGWREWKQVEALIRRQSRKTQFDGLRYKREVAAAFAKSLWKHRIDGMTPMRAQMDLHDLLCLRSADGFADSDVLRCFREACYIVFQRFAGRNVG